MHELDLVVGQGRVLGLVGPNGSGKTITLRILLGLVRPTSGHAYLFGEEVRPGAAVLGRVGALVDGPGFVPHLSGRANLALAARLIDERGGRADLDRAVALCHLDEAIDRPVSGYSHGMGYRLALAQALLGTPDLLLLDEPTNGMDPEQVAATHAAIESCVRSGATVVLATHHLDEVEQICTDAAVLQAGRLLAAGPVPELTGHPGRILVTVERVSRADGAAAALRGMAGVSAVAPAGPGTLRVDGEDLRPVDLLAALDAAGVAASGVRAGTFADGYAALLEEEALGRSGPGSSHHTAVPAP